MNKQAIGLLVGGSILFIISSALFAAGGDMGGAGRDGSVDYPYLIEDFDDFQAFCGDANYWLADVHTRLDCDLDLDPNLPGREIYARAPIAGDVTASDPNFGYSFDGIAFAGSFDGNGHVISNLTVDGGEFCGLFGCIGSLTFQLGQNFPVSNLGLENVSITGTGYYAGGLAGWSCCGGRIVNCYTTGVVTGRDGAAGLVGGNISLSSIMDSYSTCTVTGESGIGGLVGGNSESTVTNSYSTGDVSGKVRVGGLVGGNSGSVVNCYSTGDVNCLWYEAGGIAGSNYGSVTSSYSIGDVTAGGCYVGGIVGWNEGSVLLSYSRGAITGNSLVGGIVGENRGSVGSSCATGAITGGGYGSAVGGIVGGYYNDNVTSSFWDVNSCGVDISGGGMGKTTAEMKDIGTFIDAGWDFVGERSNGTSEIWQMSAVIGYPVLSFSSGYVPVALAGEGSEDDPYLIGNAEELGAVYHYNNNACFKLESDIDLNGIKWSTAVMPTFGGCFDGNGHVIYNLNIEGGWYLGLIGITDAAEVNNIALENVSITGTGGCVGGLVGYACGGYVTNSYSTGAITGKTIVGGLVGRNESLVESSYSMCAVTGGSCGGLVGENDGHVMNSYSTGDVTGSGHVGGLVGYNYNKVANSYSKGAVTGNSSVGGLVGVNYASVTSSYSSGVVTGSRYVGGFVGSDFEGSSGSVTSSFWDVETSGIGVSGDNNDGATGKTTAEMQLVSTFVEAPAGWDFADVWWINDGRDYPKLGWQPFGDLDGDNWVNMYDFAVMLMSWQAIDGDGNFNSVCELSGDNVIDEADLAELAGVWLEGPGFSDD